MVARDEELVAVHVTDHLLEHGPLQDLAEDGQYSHWPVALGIKFASFSFEERDYLGNLSLSRKLSALYGKVDDMTDRRNYVFPCQLQNIGIQVIQSTRF